MVVLIWIAVWFTSLFGIVYGIAGGPNAMASPQFILGVLGALICAAAFFWLFGSYAGTPRPNQPQVEELREEVDVPAKPQPVAEKVPIAADTDVPEPKAEPAPVSDPAFIRTRTGVNDTGRRLVDRYQGAERAFTMTEDSQILTSYEAGFSLFNIAEEFGIDQRQIVIRLTRLLLDPKDAINDEDAATSNRARYLAGEKDQIEQEYLDGVTVDEIAARHGRTVLAIGWLLLERPGRPLVDSGSTD